MDEMKAVATASNPHETLLVVDALTGQDAVNVAKGFAGEVELTGVMLTRMDGDARGGAALSMREVTGKPIKFAGVGEEIDKLEAFHPRAGRRPDPRHGRCRRPGRAGGGDDPEGRGRKDRGQDGQGQVRPRRLAHPAPPDAADGRPRRARRHDAGPQGQKGAAARRQDGKRWCTWTRSCLDDAKERATPKSSTPSARSASPRAAGPPCRRSTSCSRCTRKWRP